MKMYETRRDNPDTSDVFRTAIPPDSESYEPSKTDAGQTSFDTSEYEDEGEIEWQGEVTGAIFPMMHKRPVKARSSPGTDVSAQKGAADQFRQVPNSSPGKGDVEGTGGRLICWRLGSPDHFWKVRPNPYNPERFGKNEKGGTGDSARKGEGGIPFSRRDR